MSDDPSLAPALERKLEDAIIDELRRQVEENSQALSCKHEPGRLNVQGEIDLDG
jgi:hypothetical protein